MTYVGIVATCHSWNYVDSLEFFVYPSGEGVVKAILMFCLYVDGFKYLCMMT